MLLSESLNDWRGFDPEITAKQVETILGFDYAKQAKYFYEIVLSEDLEPDLKGFTDSIAVL